MREHSIYEVECVCGKVVETREPTFVCPECRRAGEIHWGQGYIPEEKPVPQRELAEMMT